MAEEVLYNETVTPDDPSVYNLDIETDKANINIFDEVSCAKIGLLYRKD